MSTVQNYPNLWQGFFSFLKCVYLWLCWVLVAAWASLSCREQGPLSSCGAQASHCTSFSWCEHRFSGAWASVPVARELSGCSSWALEHRPNSCGAGAYSLCGMWIFQDRWWDQDVKLPWVMAQAGSVFTDVDKELAGTRPLGPKGYDGDLAFISDMFFVSTFSQSVATFLVPLNVTK